MSELTVNKKTTPKKQDSMQSAIINIVKDKSIDHEKLKCVLEMQMLMEDRQAKNDFKIALAKFQTECPAIHKTKSVKNKNNVVMYKYAPLDEMVSIIRPFLSQNGLAFSFSITKENDGIELCLITSISHVSGHTEDSKYYFDPNGKVQIMTEAQGRKSALSYAKRAALENALGVITIDEDDDARHAEKRQITQKQKDEMELLIKQTDTKISVFLDALKVGSIDEFTESGAKQALNMLKSKKNYSFKV